MTVIESNFFLENILMFQQANSSGNADGRAKLIESLEITQTSNEIAQSYFTLVCLARLLLMRLALPLPQPINGSLACVTALLSISF